MKTFSFSSALFCCLFALLCSPVWSQAPVQVNAELAQLDLQDWQPTDNWLQAYQGTFGKQAQTQWIGELAMDGAFFTNRKTGGFLIVLPNYMYSDAKLHAKLNYGIFENKNTRLLPLSGELSQSGDHWYARFLGTVGGVPAALDLAVIDQDGDYVTVMGFFPGNEITNDFSLEFRNTLSSPKPFTNQPLAAR